MKYLSRIGAITVLALAVGMTCQAAPEIMPNAKPANPPVIELCKADLAKRIKFEAKEIRVSEVQRTTWQDSALGMPKIGQSYTGKSTPGYVITLSAKGSEFVYTASAKDYRYGGPVDSWSHSILYTKPIANEPNLNSDLYQCSLMGTNSVKVATGVSDYYPQNNGVVIVKRRTSRSGHDILFIKVDGLQKPMHLASAFDFADVALDHTQKQLATIMRTGVGSGWSLSVNGVFDDVSKAQNIPLPTGVIPQRVAWSGEKIDILVKKGEGQIAYEVSPTAAKPEWKPISYFDFPGMRDYVLNKSQSLVIDQVEKDKKQGVEVALEWFNGDRDLIARIEDFTLRSCDYIGRFVVVWGEKNSKAASCTVDLHTGEVLPCFGGISRDIKTFAWAPLTSPLKPGPKVFEK